MSIQNYNICNYVINVVASNHLQLYTEGTAVSVKFNSRFESCNCWQWSGGIGEGVP